MNETGIPKLKIKEEFKNLIRPLHQQEYLQLEENILHEGCRDPIVLWHGYIIDGHNRYEICTKHKIPFKTVEKDFSSTTEAIAWICANQLGRRNISNETRKYLIGKQYEAEKTICAKRNASGKNQYSNPDDIAPDDSIRYSQGFLSGHKTAERIAAENNVSYGTVQKYASFARAIEKIGTKEPDLVPKLLSGRYKVSHKNIVNIAKKSPLELKELNKRMNRGNNPYLKYSSVRNAITVAKPLPVSASIKDMPTYDPDAEITELTLTIPSWISSIKRVQSSADFSATTNNARTNLRLSINNLISAGNAILSEIKEN